MNPFRDEQCSCRDWGIAEEWCHLTFFCDLNLHFNNCVSSISLVLDQCVKTKEILSLAGRALSEADLWAAGGGTDVLRCKHTGYELVLKKKKRIHILGGISLYHNVDSLKTICRQSQEVFYWPWIEFLSLLNWHSLFYIKLKLIYYADTESYHCTSELISEDGCSSLRRLCCPMSSVQ